VEHAAGALSEELAQWRAGAAPADHDRALLQLLLLARLADTLGADARRSSSAGGDGGAAPTWRRGALAAVHGVLAGVLPPVLRAAEARPAAVPEPGPRGVPPPAGGWAGFQAPLQPLALRRAGIAADGRPPASPAPAFRASGGGGRGGAASGALVGRDTLTAAWGRLSREVEMDVAAAAARAAAALAGFAGLPAACGWAPLSPGAGFDPWQPLPAPPGSAALSRSHSLPSAGSLQTWPAGPPQAAAAEAGAGPAGSAESWAALLAACMAAEPLRSAAWRPARALLLAACGGSKDLLRDARAARALALAWARAARALGARGAGDGWAFDACAAPELRALAELAEGRPAVWAALCRREPSALPALLRAALRPQLAAPNARRVARLLLLALDSDAAAAPAAAAVHGAGAAKGRHGGAGGGSGGADAPVGPEAPQLDLSCFGLPAGAAVEAAPLDALETTPFAHFVASCALGWADAPARRAAAAAALAARARLAAAARRQADALLLAWAPRLSGYGAAAGDLLAGLAAEARGRGAAGSGGPPASAPGSARPGCGAPTASALAGLGEPAAAAEGAVELLHAAQGALAALAEHPRGPAYRALDAVLDLADAGAAAAAAGPAAPARATPAAAPGAPAADAAVDGEGGGNGGGSGGGGCAHCLELSAEDVPLAPPSAYSTRSLDSAASALRHFGTGAMAKLAGWQSVAGFSVGISNPSSVACVGRVALYYCAEPVAELQQVSTGAGLGQGQGRTRLGWPGLAGATRVRPQACRTQHPPTHAGSASRTLPRSRPPATRPRPPRARRAGASPPPCALRRCSPRRRRPSSCRSMPAPSCLTSPTSTPACTPRRARC
jgi:hypothetical protein